MSKTPVLPQSQVIEETASIWGAALHPAGCPACQRVYLVEDARIGQRCPLCAREKLQTQPALLRPEAPELLAPFRYQPGDLRARLDKFVSEVWLRSDDFQTDRLLQRAAPVYWPAWLVDGDVVGDWQAEAGFDYQVKSSQESYGAGGWSTREVVEGRIRWEPRTGQIKRRYDNVAAPALSEQKHLSKRTGRYQFEQAGSYQPDQLRGAFLLVPDLPPESAWPLAQAQLDEAAADECRQAAGAQHIRNFSLRADYQSLNWTQQLLPLYVTWYSDDEGTPRILYLNGQSGAIGGTRLASQKKGWKLAGMILVVAAVTLLAALFFAVVGALFPPGMIFAGLLALAAMLIACAAIVPAAWPWQWNRGQTGES
jgi:hypothetical protein